jgi:MFS family permease
MFGLSNFELGTAYGVYGIVAMLAYMVGGPLADRFGARAMLVIALTTTAAGGLLLITIPTLSTLILLYAYWGITTIALFWAPLIRATREWGGEMSQGVTFGLLDGG